MSETFDEKLQRLRDEEAARLPAGTPDYRDHNLTALTKGFTRGVSIGQGERVTSMAQAAVPDMFNFPSQENTDMIMENYEQNLDERFTRNRQISEQNPIMNFIGETAGSIATGATALKGVNKAADVFLWLGNTLKKTDTIVGRAGKAAVGGAAYGGVYAEGQDTDIPTGIGLGAAGGFGGQLVLGELLPALGRGGADLLPESKIKDILSVGGKANQSNIKMHSVDELRRILQEKNIDGNPDQIAQRLYDEAERLGPNATIADLDEALYEQGLQSLSDLSTVAASKTLVKGFQQRASASPNAFAAAMKPIYDEGKPLSRGFVERQAKKDFATFSPQMKQVLRQTDMPFPERIIKKMLDDTFQINEVFDIEQGVSRKISISESSQSAYDSLLKEFDRINDITKDLTTSAGVKITRKEGAWTAQDLLNLRSKVDALYSDSISTFASGAEKGRVKVLGAFRDELNKMLKQVPGFDNINAQYAEVHSMKAAYDLGEKYLKDKAITKTDIEEVFTTMTPNEHMSFVYSVQHSIAQLMDTAGGDMKLAKKLAADKGYIEKLEAVIPQGLQDDMFQTAQDMVNFGKKDAKFVKNQGKAILRAPKGIIGDVFDAFTMSAGLLTPYVSQAAGLGAARRLMSNPQGTGSRMQTAVTDMLAQPVHPEMIEQLAAQGHNISPQATLSDIFASGNMGAVQQMTTPPSEGPN